MSYECQDLEPDYFRDWADRRLEADRQEDMIPGFPGGRFCPRCAAGWLIIIAVVACVYIWAKRREEGE